jgi:predicted O-methyltransferase YrrM
MTDARWTDTDDYLAEQLLASDDALATALEESASAGLPSIAVSPLQGKFLHILARLMGATRVLEIGTLGGYSAIWMGRALGPDGRLVSLELSPEHARVARANVARAGLDKVVDVVVGPALASLPRLLEQEGPGSFDLTFIDADKPNNPHYWEWALKLTRPGGAIVVDNVVRDGKLPDASSTDAAVVGSRQLIEAMGRSTGAVSSALQTVGHKGYDGFAIAFVNGP